MDNPPAMLDLTALDIFRTVAAEGSVTRAAERLSRAQSNVTTRVRQLEADLGATLFLREGKRMALTPEGEVLLGYASRLLALAEEARQALRPGRPGGNVRILTQAYPLNSCSGDAAGSSTMTSVFARLGSDFLSSIVFLIVYGVSGDVVLATAVGIAAAIAHVIYARVRGKPLGFMTWASLALVIVLNKALNDMVHVARANAGLPKLADTHGETAPRGGLVAKLRRATRFVPFHRLYHSVELTLIAFAAAIVGLFAGQPLVDRIVVTALLPLAVLALLGHFVAIMASRRVRA